MGVQQPLSTSKEVSRDQAQRQRTDELSIGEASSLINILKGDGKE
jgi:hypothetical protein